MAELTFNNAYSNSSVVVTKQTLTASDTFTLPTSSRCYLQLDNGTGGDLTVTMTGAGVPATVSVNGYGTATFDNIQVPVTNGEAVMVALNSRAQLLQGTVTVTGGTGIVAILFTA